MCVCVGCRKPWLKGHPGPFLFALLTRQEGSHVFPSRKPRARADQVLGARLGDGARAGAGHCPEQLHDLSFPICASGREGWGLVKTLGSGVRKS